MERTPTQAGEVVSARRRQIGADVAELARQAQVDVKTIRSLEAGERMPRDSTKAKIERALNWSPGSIDAILAGGDPVVADEGPPMTTEEAAIRDELVAIIGRGARDELAHGLPEGRVVSQDALSRLLRAHLALDDLIDSGAELGVIKSAARIEEHHLYALIAEHYGSEEAAQQMIPWLTGFYADVDLQFPSKEPIHVRQPVPRDPAAPPASNTGDSSSPAEEKSTAGVDRQSDYDLAYRAIPGPTDAEKRHAAQDAAAEAPDEDGPDGGA